MFLVWQFVSDLLVPSVTWWVTWNSDDYRDAGTNEAKYTNGARPDAARDNGAILTRILWSCSRVPCFSLTNDANIWPSENIFIELINGSDIMAVICWKLMVSTGRVYQPDIAIIIIFVKWYVHYSGSPSDHHDIKEVLLDFPYLPKAVFSPIPRWGIWKLYRTPVLPNP